MKAAARSPWWNADSVPDSVMNQAILMSSPAREASNVTLPHPLPRYRRAFRKPFSYLGLTLLPAAKNVQAKDLAVNMSF
jgi:hypothetical protein